jgi:hypothetical protein
LQVQGGFGDGEEGVEERPAVVAEVHHAAAVQLLELDLGREKGRRGRGGETLVQRTTVRRLLAT